MKNSKDQVLLVGCGDMAIQYAKVLVSLKVPFIVVGRGEGSAHRFKTETGISALAGGVDIFFKNGVIIPQKAIVAIDGDQLGHVVLKLLHYGIKSILLEKPGGIDFSEIAKVSQSAKRNKAKIYVAYNRRFYVSVQKAQEIIKQDRGVLSYFFEFTEWSSVVDKLKTAKSIKDNWFLHNSTHVVDLAFFLGGYPQKISTYSAGFLSWHSKAAIFSGAGITEQGALFSYHANWKGPGRWGLELITKNHRLILRPLEKLQIQKHGSMLSKFVPLDDKQDTQYNKPGLYKQTEAFLTDNKENLCSIVDQWKACKIYKKIVQG